MEYIAAKNVDDLFIKIARRMLEKGEENSPRGLKTLELKDTWLELEDINNPICSLESRKLNKDYLKHEFEWYLSGDLKVDNISRFATMWAKLKDSNGTVNSNYGYLTMIQKWGGKSQLEWCIDSLNKDKYTRQAIMNYNQPIHKYEGNKDFVCTLNQSFITRDEKLDSIVLMRSNDLIYGLSYDLPWFIYLQKEVSNKTNIDIGKYHHYATSLHVYEKHFKMLEQIAKEQTR